MAWSVKYSKQFQRIGTTATYRVDILSEVGGGVITPWKMGADPFQISIDAASRDEEKIVIGSEATFEFVLNKRTGEADYDPLFESEYRDHIVKFYREDGPDTILWQGYLQPENMYKSIFESNLHIYLSATDGLKDLANYDFFDDNEIIADHRTGLEIIKLCVENLDVDSQFQYNFIVKLGTKHDGQGANDTALHEVTHDTRRFYHVRDGGLDVDNCLEVIEKVLQPYACTIQQWGAKYYILSKHEAATNYYTYNWALAFQSKAASNDSVDISSGYKFRRGGDKSLLPPVKEVGLRLLNRNIGTNLVANINDFDGGDWDYGNYTSAFDDSGAILELTAAAGAPLVSNGYITLAADETIQKLTEGDYLKLRFSYLCSDTILVGNPWFRISTIRDGVETFGEHIRLSNGIMPFTYESNLTSMFALVGDVSDSYDYNFRIYLYSNSVLSDYDMHLYGFTFGRCVVVNEEAMNDVSFDISYRGVITQGKKKEDIGDIYFGDTPTTDDFAALVYSGSNTDEWNREGEADSQSLLWILAKNYLISRQDYTEYINVEIKDSSDNIVPINYIEWDSKKYHIVSYEKSFRHSWITLHLKEWLTDNISIEFEEIPLTSVDGESSGGTSVYVPATSTTSHNSLTGIQGGSVNEHYHLNSSEYTELHGWLDNVTLGNDGSTTLAGTTTLSSTTLVPDGGTVGQAAGPLLTFDDSNNYLEITGCKVGINITTPQERVHIYEASANARMEIECGDGHYAGYIMTNSEGSFMVYTDADKFHIWDNIDSANRFTIDGDGKVGINTINPNAEIESLAITEQLRLSYDATHYCSFTVANTGSMTVAPIAGQDILFSLSGTGDFIVNTNDLFVDTSTGFVGIGTAAPATDLHVYSAGAAQIEVESNIGSTASLRLTNSEGSYGWYTDGDKLIVYDYNDTANRIQIDGDGNFMHPSWATGWFGNNWRIAENGDTEIENLLVRASARFRELIIDQLSIIAGSNLMSIARGKIESIDIPNSKVTLEDPNNRGACSFAVDDFFWIKSVDIDKNLFSDCRGQITAVVGTTLTLSFAVTGANGAIGDIAEGDVIVQRGNSSDADRQALIYTTVSDADAPFERVMTGVDSLAAFNDLNNVVWQSGNLDNLDSHDIVPASPGYGLYSNNVYLSGTIHSYDGIIGAWAINSTTITGGDAILDSDGILTLGTGDDVAILSAADATYRLWIGDATAADAPFRVTKAGALTATGCVELGTAAELHSGEWYSAAIKGGHIWENYTENDSGLLMINNKGFQGGQSYYRRTYIYDGKGHELFWTDGYSNSVGVGWSSRNVSDFHIYADAMTIHNSSLINFSDVDEIDFGSNHTVITSSSDDTCAVAISDIIGFSTSFTPKGNKIFVYCSIPFHPTSTDTSFNLYIYLDAASHYDCIHSIHTASNIVSAGTIIDVTPGTTYTVKLRWSGTTAMQYLGSTGTYGQGHMSVIDLH